MPMFTKKYIFIILCLVFPLALSAIATDEEDKLQEMKRDRDRLKREKASVTAREKSVLAETKVIEKQLVAKERELRVYELNLDRCEREIKLLTAALAEAESRSQQTRSLMIKRLRAMYKFGYDGGQLNYLKLLIGADDVSDLINRYKYMSAIASGDRMLLKKAIDEKEEIGARKMQVEDRKEEILFFKGRSEKTKSEIVKKSQIRQGTLAKLRKSKDQLTKTISELDRSVKELEVLVAQLRSNPQQGDYANLDNLEKMRGRLTWPVSGKIIDNTSPSMKGVTIQSRYGADIRCVASGVVEYARWFDGVGYGQMVIVNHGSGYRTLYAHASELLVQKGQRVSKDQVIARVGETGSIKGPILYFEIWKGNSAMLTRQWLR